MISQHMQLMSLEVFDRKFAQKLPGEIAVTHLNGSPIARGKGHCSDAHVCWPVEPEVGFVPSDDLRSLAEFKQKLCRISLH